MKLPRLAFHQWVFLFGAAAIVVGVVWTLFEGIDHKISGGPYEIGGRGAERVAYWNFNGTALILTGAGVVICLLAFLWAMMDRWRKP